VAGVVSGDESKNESLPENTQGIFKL